MRIADALCSDLAMDKRTASLSRRCVPECYYSQAYVGPIYIQLGAHPVLGFEQVFLDMVLQIKTEQDRLDVIVELEQFIVSHFRPAILIVNATYPLP